MGHPANSGCALRALAVGLLTIAVASCSILNPHVDPGLPRPRLAPDASAKDQPVIKFYGDLPAAIDYANSLRQEYYDAVGEQSLLRNGMAMTLVPISAAALFLGINSGTDASRTAITALGIGGASIYALGDFLYSKPRQAIYLAGSEAVGCAVLASRPFLVPAEEMDAFGTSLKEIYPAMERVARELASYEAAATNDADLAYAATVRAQLTRAAEVLAKGSAIDDEIDKAAVVLVTATDTIRDQVSAQIVKDEPDFDAILSLVGGIGSLATTIGPPPVVKGADGGTNVTGQSAGGVKGGRAHSVALEQAAVDLSKHVAVVFLMVSRVEAARQAAGELAACKPADAVSPLTILPTPPVRFAAGEAGTRGLVVSGGNSPYKAELLDVPASGSLKVQQTTDFGPRIDITISSAVPDNTYNARVADISGRNLVFQIIVGDGVAKRSGNNDQGSKRQDKPPPLDQALVQAARAKLLCVVNTGAGEDDSKFRAALKIHRDAVGSAAKGDPTLQELQEISNLPECVAGAQNRFESAILPVAAELQPLLKDFGIDQVLTLDSPQPAGGSVRALIVEQTKATAQTCGGDIPGLGSLDLGVTKMMHELRKRVLEHAQLTGDALKAKLCASLES